MHNVAGKCCSGNQPLCNHDFLENASSILLSQTLLKHTIHIIHQELNLQMNTMLVCSGTGQ